MKLEELQNIVKISSEMKSHLDAAKAFALHLEALLQELEGRVDKVAAVNEALAKLAEGCHGVCAMARLIQDNLGEIVVSEIEKETEVQDVDPTA